MRRDISTFWVKRIHHAVPDVPVIPEPIRAHETGFDGRVTVLARHYRLTANLTRFAKVADGVRVCARNNLQRLIEARQILREMGVDFQNGYRSIVIGKLSYAQFEKVMLGLVNEQS
jgi:hypothetical protein